MRFLQLCVIRRRYLDRKQAGTVLARTLHVCAAKCSVIVLGLPRGGVPVAKAVAESLKAPFDVMVVHKLGVPGQEELAMGAVASAGMNTVAMVLNRDVLDRVNLDDDELQRVTKRESEAVMRREQMYRGQSSDPLPTRGRTVIVVDDGLATGATMRAAITLLRELPVAERPAEIVAGAPVGSASSIQALRTVADQIVCPMIIDDHGFGSVARWYEDFTQVDDQAVYTALRARRR